MLIRVQAVAGAGKTTFIIDKILSLAGQVDKVLVLVFQKQDRLDFLNRLNDKGVDFDLVGDKQKGITVAKVFVEDKTIEVHVSNLHAFVYNRIRDGRLPYPVEEDKEFWKTFMPEYAPSEAISENFIGDTYGDGVLHIYNYLKNAYGTIQVFDLIRDLPEGYALLEGYRRKGILIAEKDLVEFERKLRSVLNSVAFYEYVWKKNEKKTKDRKPVYGFLYSDLIERIKLSYFVGYPVIFVDEAQDIPFYALKVLSEVAVDSDVYLVGDTAQRIFYFNGVGSLDRLNYDEVITLNRTYRVPSAFKKAFDYSDVKQVEFIRHGGYFKRDFPTFYNMVLVRNRVFISEAKKLFPGFQVLNMENYLKRISLISTHRKAGRGEINSRYEKKNLKDLVRYLMPEEVSFMEKRGLNVLEDEELLMELYKKALRLGRHHEKLLKPFICIDTIHKAKGKEAWSVVVYNKATSTTKISELLYPEGERAIKHVALTRAKAYLYIEPPLRFSIKALYFTGEEAIF